MSGQNFRSIWHLVGKTEFWLENRGSPVVISDSAIGLKLIPFFLQLALEIWREVIIEPIKEKLVAEILIEIRRLVSMLV